MHTYLIVGLGNPGEKYAQTRHNAGRIALEHFLRSHELSLEKDPYANAMRARTMYGDAAVEVLFPETYMNRSGDSVRFVVQDQDIPAEHIIVVHDDVDLPIKSIKISFGRGDGGHNGVASIIKALNTKDLIRIRVGVAPVSFFGHMKKPTGEGAAARFLLGTFSSGERKKVEQVGETVAEALATIIENGKTAAMNRFN